jgi:hypothetical protein
MEETSRGVSRRRRAARWSRWTVLGPTSQEEGQPRVQLTGDEHAPIGTALPDPASAAGDCGFWNVQPSGRPTRTCSTGRGGENLILHGGGHVGPFTSV